MSSSPDLPGRMRAAVQHAPGEFRLEERPVPQPGPGQVLVTRRIGLDEVPGAMIDLAGGADEIKVVVEYDRR